MELGFEAVVSVAGEHIAQLDDEDTGGIEVIGLRLSRLGGDVEADEG
jgi:hypothetical protein